MLFLSPRVTVKYIHKLLSDKVLFPHKAEHPVMTYEMYSSVIDAYS